MIKEDKVLVKINLRNSTFYKNKGYDVSSKEILVDVKDLTTSSKSRVTAICEICNSENSVTYGKYNINKNRNNKGYYSCFNCKNIEKEKTCIEKYGVKSYSMTEEFKSSESEKWKGIKKGHDKAKITMLEKYGVDSYFKTIESKEYNRRWMSSDEFKEKSKNKIIEKYGVDHYSKTEKFKTEIESKKDIILDKIKETFIEKYNVDWISKVNNIKDKIRKTKESKGNVIPDELISKWHSYKRKVRNITNLNKKKLYENWNGYDYYDNELIKGYLSHTHTHRFYPTIDHKISVYFGFINNISPEEIGSLENLCITKRFINAIKGKLVEEDFIYNI